jgi:hypothetical protein
MKKTTTKQRIIYILKTYLQTLANIEISKMNIEFYTKELNKVRAGGVTLVEYDEIFYMRKNLFDYMYFSDVEKEVLKNESVKYADEKNLQEKIYHERGLFDHYNAIVDLVETSLKTLTKKEKFIIEIKYLSDISYKWEDITKNFNRHFKTEVSKDYLLNELHHKIIEKLEKTMGNCYIINLIF